MTIGQFLARCKVFRREQEQVRQWQDFLSARESAHMLNVLLPIGRYLGVFERTNHTEAIRPNELMAMPVETDKQRREAVRKSIIDRLDAYSATVGGLNNKGERAARAALGQPDG